LAAVPGINSDETSVHNYFKSQQIPGDKEWFYSSPELRGYVRWLRMQWFTLRTLEEADNDEIARSHDNIDSSLWLPTESRAEFVPYNTLLPDQDELALELEVGQSDPWADVIDVEPQLTGDDFYTDERIIRAAKLAMGGVDLDPATHPVANRRFIRAPRIYTLTTNGLAHDWYGKVWCNPPFGQWAVWADKIISEWDSGRVTQMCVLMATRSITAKAVAKLWCRATRVCITEGRIPFWGPKAVSGPDDGHAIFYFGDNADAFRDAFQEIGHVLKYDTKVGR